MRLIHRTGLSLTSWLALAWIGVHAETLTPAPLITKPWSLELGVGYGNYQDMSQSDGQTPLARIGVGKTLVSLQQLRAGLEMAFQTGNDARLDAAPDIIDALGGLPIDTTFKSTLDLLFTGKYYPSANNPTFLQMKGGFILRHWQFSRGSINDLTRVSPELQLGAGVDISRLASLSLSYQRIQGSNPSLRVVSPNCLARVTSIPGENALILGLSVYLI